MDQKEFAAQSRADKKAAGAKVKDNHQKKESKAVEEKIEVQPQENQILQQHETPKVEGLEIKPNLLINFWRSITPPGTQEYLLLRYCLICCVVVIFFD